MLKKEKLTTINSKSFVPFSCYLLCLFLNSCFSGYSVEQPQTTSSNIPQPKVENTDAKVAMSLPTAIEHQQLLQQSWAAYRQRFIQADGRVIDRQDGDRSTSEAQAYAMLRAVLIDDPATFATTLNWAENNLQRRNIQSSLSNKPTDGLWVWKWGRDVSGKWGVIDPNFASDADIDGITALILASRRWQRPDYLKLAVSKLQDLWQLSTVTGESGTRYLLPGPKAAFVKQQSVIKLNPSYLAPYAFRLFAQVDPAHNWLSLVDSSYQVLENSSQLSAVGLPSDWVLLNTQTGQFQSLPESGPNKTLYGFDAYRVWWRVALDAAWFNEPKALQFLRSQLGHIQQQWANQQKIAAQINLQGDAIVDYEATSNYAMLYAALRLIDSKTAQQVLEAKLLPVYHDGIWENDSAYYTQNLAWLGLLPPTATSSELLNR